VSDIFREVDEEIRREQLKRLWDRYGILVIALCVAIIAAVGGWRFYEWSENRKAFEAGAAFESAILLSEQGKHADAEQAFAKIAKEGTPGYRALARLREAAALAERDPKAAVAVYDSLTNDTSLNRALQDLAALRSGFILVDSAPYDDMVRRLESLTAPDRAFRHSARQLLALSAWRSGNSDAAQRWFDMILTDSETPAGTRGQIEMLMALAGADRKT
jgi:hypothetical protein